MSLIEIEYGSLASSETMNHNFEYLDNKIAETSNNFVSQIATVNSNIASVSATVSANKDVLEETVENAQKEIERVFTDNSLYVKTTVNGTSWAREYFSDKEKTERVWVEQGGRVNVNYGSTATVALVKPFHNTNYYCSANPLGWTDISDNINIVSLENSTFTVFGTGVSPAGHWGSVNAFWYACGV